MWKTQRSWVCIWQYKRVCEIAVDGIPCACAFLIWINVYSPEPGPVLNSQASFLLNWVELLVGQCSYRMLYGGGIFLMSSVVRCINALANQLLAWCQRFKGREFGSRIWQHKLICEIPVDMGFTALMHSKNVCMHAFHVWVVYVRYVWMYAGMYALHAYMYVCMYVYVHVCMWYVRMYACMYVCMYACKYVWVDE